MGLMIIVLALQTGCAGSPLRSDFDGASYGNASLQKDVIRTARGLLGSPYKYGGTTPAGFDCSGFTRHVFEQTLGIELPRSAHEQALAPMLRQVSSRDALQPGDLVFFNTQRKTFSHVGIYLGDGRFIHAPRTGAQIRTESLAAAYWSRRYTGARRAAVIEANP